MASIIAIDFGNKNCIVAVPKDGNINVLNNQASQRLTPTMISFTNCRRYFGVFAQQKQMENVSSTITQIKQLVGLKYDSQKRENIQQLEPCSLVKSPTGFTFIKLEFLNKEVVFSVEQCIAFLLKGCFDIAKLNCIFADQCVIIVPPWWSEIERRIIIDSAKIAGIKVAKFLNSTTAEAITYFMDHKKMIEQQNTKYVAFIDFGDSCLNSSIVQFNENAIEVKSYCCDENIGGSNFTIALVKYLFNVIEKKKLKPPTKQRSIIRFIESAEKLKQRLSTNQEMIFEADSLENGASVSFNVKRSDFEDQVKDLINSIANPIEKSIQMANISLDDIFAVELHGGTSRIPAVKAKIAEIFHKEPKQSINSDECFATGAGYQAAIISSQFNRNVKISDICYHRITIECADFPERNHRKELFKQFQVIPCGKVLTHRVAQETMINIYCDDKVKLGSIYIRLKFQMEAALQITIRLTQDGIIEVPKVEPVRPKDRRYMQPNLNDNYIEFKYKPMFQLHDAVINDMIEQEKEMEEIDKNEEERDEARNSLESYLFKLKNALDYDGDYFNPAMIEKYKELVNDVDIWFYEKEFERYSAKKYNKILDELKLIGDDAFKRQKNRENLPTIVNRLISRAERCKNLLKHLLEEEEEDYSEGIDQISYEIDQFIEDVYKRQNEIENIPCYLDMTIDEDDLNNQLYRIEKRIKSIREQNN